MLALVLAAAFAQVPTQVQPLNIEPPPVLDVPLDKRVAALLESGASKYGWAGGLRAVGIAGTLGGLAVMTYQSITRDDQNAPGSPILGLSIVGASLATFIIGHVISNFAELDFAAASGQPKQ